MQVRARKNKWYKWYPMLCCNLDDKLAKTTILGHIDVTSS